MPEYLKVKDLIKLLLDHDLDKTIFVTVNNKPYEVGLSWNEDSIYLGAIGLNSTELMEGV